MLAEAIDVIRLLWRGGSQSHFGHHYTVEQATIFTLPDEPPPIVVSGFGRHSVDLAARIGDGLFMTAPDADLVDRFRNGGGGDKPVYGKLDMALAESEADARRLALETWPTAALGGELGQVLPLPAHFEAAVAHVTEDDVAESILCSQDPDAHIARLQEFERAGYDRVVVQQVGLGQDRLFEMYAGSVLPAFAGALT